MFLIQTRFIHVGIAFRRKTAIAKCSDYNKRYEVANLQQSPAFVSEVKVVAPLVTLVAVIVIGILLGAGM